MTKAPITFILVHKKMHIVLYGLFHKTCQNAYVFCREPSTTLRGQIVSKYKVLKQNMKLKLIIIFRVVQKPSV